MSEGAEKPFYGGGQYVRCTCGRDPERGWHESSCPLSRAGERADAIPEADPFPLFIDEWLCPTCGGPFCRGAGEDPPHERPRVAVRYVRAAHPGAGSEVHPNAIVGGVAQWTRSDLITEVRRLRAAHPEAGSEEAERLLSVIGSTSCNCRSKAEDTLRAAHPEADRAPETRAGQEEQWDQGSSGVGEADRAPETDEQTDEASSPHGVSVDRAPSEVETVARQRAISAIAKVRNDSNDCACDGCIVDAVLNAVRGRSRDDIEQVCEDHDLVPGALAQRFKDERNIAREKLRRFRDDTAEQLNAMLADVERTERGMASHSGHGQMVARAALGERLAEGVRAIRAAHPEDDRAPGQRDRDRALNVYMAEHGPNAQRRRRDAERREADQARDDTVALVGALQRIDDHAKAGDVSRFWLIGFLEPILARFGAGRAEDKPPPAKDPTQ